MPYTILLVDDDPVFREEFRELLLMEKYDVLEAPDGKECLRIIKKPNIIDLVILDQKMPDMNGTKVLRKLKQIDPELSIIILTGYSTKEVAIDALRGNADDYLEKPLKVEKALMIIKKVLKKKQREVTGIINKIKYLIEKNFHRNVTLKEASEIVYLSPKYISRLFKKKTGTGFREYKLSVKMDRARELLNKTDYNINEISYKIGYLNIGSFITSFKKTTGCTPTEYRQGNVINTKKKGEKSISMPSLNTDNTTHKKGLSDRKYLLNIINSIQTGIVICGLDCQIKFVNNVIINELGDPAGNRCFKYIYNKEHTCFFCNNKQGFSKKTIISEWYNPNTGSYFKITESFLINPDQSISKLLVFDNITEQKNKVKHLEKSQNKLESQTEMKNKQLEAIKSDLRKKEKQIRISNELFEKIFLNTHFYIAFLDSNFTFIKVNKAYANFYMESADFFEGKNYFEFNSHNKQREIFNQVNVSGISYITYSETFKFPGIYRDRSIYWDWSLQPLISEQNEVEGLIFIAIDVTERKKAENKLIRTQKKLSDTRRLSDIGTLAATVAHELRNPLGVIQTAIYNIKRKSKDTRFHRHIKNIEKKISESEQIINNLLNYSKIKKPQLKQIHLFYFLEECINTIMAQYQKYNVIINKKYDSVQGINIFIDPFQIREVINNILNNAYQAFPEKEGGIDVSGHIHDNLLILIIKDTGKGIDKKDIKKIFTPFFTRKSKGTGLGLSICRELINLHNGTIEIKSKKGKGTKVTITLPVEEKNQ